MKRTTPHEKVSDLGIQVQRLGWGLAEILRGELKHDWPSPRPWRWSDILVLVHQVEGALRPIRTYVRRKMREEGV